MAAFANHVLQSTAFAALAWMLTLFLRHNHARTRYWVWLAASMKFLIPFSLFMEIGHRLRWTAAPTIVEPRVAIVMDEISQPFAAPDVSVAPAVHVTASSPIVPELLFAIWICGCAAVLFYWLARRQRVRGALGAAVPLREGREYDSLRRMEKVAGVERPTELFTSDAPLEPGVFGIFRQRLWMPQGLAERLDDAQLDAIFAHELCHLRRRDNLTAALHMVVNSQRLQTVCGIAAGVHRGSNGSGSQETNRDDHDQSRCSRFESSQKSSAGCRRYHRAGVARRIGCSQRAGDSGAIDGSGRVEIRCCVDPAGVPWRCGYRGEDGRKTTEGRSARWRDDDEPAE
jgi:Zn-dependent protease with chaperone function